VSRLLLLVIFALWLANPVPKLPSPLGEAAGVALFLAGYVLLVGAVAIWARRLAARLETGAVPAAQRQFNRVLTAVRWMVVLWFAAGLFGCLGWGRFVADWIAPWITLEIPHDRSDGLSVQLALPALLVGTMPALLAWIGLLWAQFPADRALREQSVLDQLELDLPVHAPPRVGHYLAAGLRQQVLFIGLPILLILLVRDLIMVGVRVAHIGIGRVSDFDDWILLPSAIIVFLVAPEVLRRVLRTRRLPDGELRSRLERICRRIRLRYREILLWETQYSMGNAAVMGLLPQMRYILISDLLLESLTDQQIEAVFAHEAGHVVHHHMAWYAAFFALMALAAVGPGAYIDSWFGSLARSWGVWRKALAGGTAAEILQSLGSLLVIALFFAMFGFISRRCERQADVFAARMMENNWGDTLRDEPAGAPDSRPNVGQTGAAVFASALHRVAVINNIPVAARSWCHGSIARRMAYLQALAGDPRMTTAFDRSMTRMYALLIAAILMCAAVAVFPPSTAAGASPRASRTTAAGR